MSRDILSHFCDEQNYFQTEGNLKRIKKVIRNQTGWLKELRHGWRILKKMANFFKFAVRNLS